MSDHLIAPSSESSGRQLFVLGWLLVVGRSFHVDVHTASIAPSRINLVVGHTQPGTEHVHEVIRSTPTEHACLQHESIVTIHLTQLDQTENGDHENGHEGHCEKKIQECPVQLVVEHQENKAIDQEERYQHGNASHQT